MPECQECGKPATHLAWKTLRNWNSPKSKDGAYCLSHLEAWVIHGMSLQKIQPQISLFMQAIK